MPTEPSLPYCYEIEPEAVDAVTDWLKANQNRTTIPTVETWDEVFLDSAGFDLLERGEAQVVRQGSQITGARLILYNLWADRLEHEKDIAEKEIDEIFACKDFRKIATSQTTRREYNFTHSRICLDTIRYQVNGLEPVTYYRILVRQASWSDCGHTELIQAVTAAFPPPALVPKKYHFWQAMLEQVERVLPPENPDQPESIAPHAEAGQTAFAIHA